MHLTMCHQIPERSFFFKGKQFPMCSRCMGIQIGYLSLPVFLFGLASIPLWWSILLVIPTYLDGFVQLRTNYVSNNARRFITGIISGVGTMSLTSIIGIYIGSNLKLLIN